MRIRAVRIGSYGGIRDLDLEFGDGLTAVYGDNETGKTTVLEFIRSTLFQDRKQRYPSRSSTDSGELDIETDAGERVTLVRKGNRITGDAGLPAGIDSETYRSVFAMAPEDLRNAKVISSGDIKNRFLTVPGGEALPGVIKDIDERMRSLQSPERASPTTEIVELENAIAENEAAVAASAARDAEYGEVQAELERLLEEQAAAGAAVEANRELMAAKALHESQKSNREKLSALKARAAELAASTAVTDDDIREYERLGYAVRSTAEASEKEAEQRSARLLGLDPEELIRQERAIGGLRQMAADRRRLAADIDRIGQELGAERAAADARAATAEAETGLRARRRRMLLGAGAGAMAASVLLAVIIGTASDSVLYPAAVLAAGAAVLAVTAFRASLSGRAAEAAPAADPARITELREEAEALTRRYDETGREWEVLTAALGFTGTPEDGAYDLEQALNTAQDLMRLRQAERARRAELEEFLARFGSEQEFIELRDMKAEREEAEVMIGAVEAAIEESGRTGDGPVEEPRDHGELTGRHVELVSRVADTRNRLKAIREDDEAERLLDDRARLEAELEDRVADWARLSLAATLINDACDTIYSELQPGVIATADRLLGRMTGGRYGVEMDLRENMLKAVSGSSGKKQGEWSTGLGDQLLLAVKLAVARELAGETPLPVLLDDILQMFDHGRRAAACEALADLAEDMQVILFTCDRNTASMLEATGRCRLVELPSKA